MVLRLKILYHVNEIRITGWDVRNEYYDSNNESRLTSRVTPPYPSQLMVKAIMISTETL